VPTSYTFVKDVGAMPAKEAWRIRDEDGLEMRKEVSSRGCNMWEEEAAGFLCQERLQQTTDMKSHRTIQPACQGRE